MWSNKGRTTDIVMYVGNGLLAAGRCGFCCNIFGYKANNSDYRIDTSVAEYK